MRPRTMAFAAAACLLALASVLLLISRRSNHNGADSPSGAAELTQLHGHVKSRGTALTGARLMVMRLDTDSGMPEPVSVLQKPAIAPPLPFGLSDSEGSFQFWIAGRAGTPPDGPVFMVKAEADGFEPRVLPVIPQLSSSNDSITATSELSFDLVQSSRVHRMMVLDKKSRSPLGGAQVLLSCVRGSDAQLSTFEGITSASGQVELRGIPEQEAACSVTVNAALHTSFGGRYRNSELPGVVEVLGLGNWDGVVREAGTGQPIPGVVLRVRASGTDVSASTDTSGRFRLGNLPLGVDLSFELEADDHALSLPVPVVRIPEEPAEVHQDLRVVAGFPMDGRVVDGKGVPIPNARVSFMSEIAPDKPGTSPTQSIGAGTDSMGRFHARGLQTGLVWTVTASHDDYVDTSLRHRPLKRGDFIDLTMKGGGMIVARVSYGSAGRPAPRVKVRRVALSAAVPVGVRLIVQTTNEAGEARFPREVSGDYQLDCVRDVSDDHPFASVRVNVTAGTVVVNLSMPEPGRIAGALTTDSSVPSPGSLLAELVEVKSGQQIALEGRITEGSYELQPVMAGTYRIKASVPEGAPVLKEGVQVRAGETTQLPLHFSGGQSLRGIVSSGGTPVEGASIVAYPYPEESRAQDPGPSGSATTVIAGKSEADGTFELRGLKPGEPLRIDVKHPEYAPWTSGATYARSAPAGEVRIELDQPARLSLKLTRGDKGPVEGIQVVFEHSVLGLVRGFLTSDSDGVVTGQSLPAGSYQLYLSTPSPQRHSNLERKLTHSVRLSAGKTTHETLDITF